MITISRGAFQLLARKGAPVFFQWQLAFAGAQEESFYVMRSGLPGVLFCEAVVLINSQDTHSVIDSRIQERQKELCEKLGVVNIHSDSDVRFL